MSEEYDEPMRVIIAGSRDYHNYDTLLEAIEESEFKIEIVVSGGANGVDALGEEYAENMNIPLHVFNADWERHGRAAGHAPRRRLQSPRRVFQPARRSS